MSAAAIALLAILLAAAPASVQAPVPVGGEFQVNSYTTSDQRYPAVAAGPTATSSWCG